MILFIDDDTVLQQLISAIFKQNNYEVTVMKNSNDAIQWLASDNICNLIITDMHMKNGSGLELVHWTRVHAKGLPVIVSTGADIISLQDSGSYEEIKDLPFLSKPFNTQQLLNKVKSHYRACGLKCG
jgi:DNA-binding NtrC family response regulator